MRARRNIALAGLVVLLALVAGAAILAASGLHASDASYTTSSQTDVTASAASATDWIHVYSQSTDPDRLGGYARQQNVASQPLIAGGADAALAIDWGDYPDLNKTFTFSRVLTVKTPPAFPMPAVTQVTVTATLAPDAGGTQPLRNQYLHLVGQTGFTNSVTMRADQKAQLDISLRTKKNPWDAGDEFHPHIVLTLTYAGGPASYYVLDYTTLLYII